MNDQTTSGISRRTLAKGAAWSVPAAAVVAAAPAYAASLPVIVRPAGNACKHPGNPKWYHFTFCFKNTSAAAVTVTLTSMIVNGVTGPQMQPGTINVPAGDEVCAYVDAGLFGDSANGTATLNYSVPGTDGPMTGSVSTSFNDIPPCGTGADPCDNPSGNPPHDGAVGITPCTTTTGASASDASTEPATLEGIEETASQQAPAAEPTQAPATTEATVAPEAPAAEVVATEAPAAEVVAAEATATPEPIEG